MTLVKRANQSNTNTFTLYSLLVLFIVSRLLFLFFSPFAYYHEDEKVLSLPSEIINQRLEWPFWLHLDSPHSGGSIYSSIITIPFFLLFGESYLSAKLVGITISTLSFGFVIFFFKKEYSEKMAIMTALLLIFAPTRKLIHDLIRIGNTAEFELVAISSLMLAYLISRQHKIQPSRLILLGILMGLGFWIQYSYVIIMIGVLIYWLTTICHKMSIKFIGLIGLGLLIGLTPFIIYNFQYQFASFTSDPLMSQTLIKMNHLLVNMKYFFLSGVPGMFLFWGNKILSYKFLSYWFASLFYLSLFYSLLTLTRFFSKPSKKIKGFGFAYLLTIVALLTIMAMNFSGIQIDLYIYDQPDVTVWSHYYLGLFLWLFLLLFPTAIHLFERRNNKNMTLINIIYLASLVFLIINYITNITLDRTKFTCLQFGKHYDDICKPINLTKSLPNRLVVNTFLLTPHKNVLASVYETGYSFSANMSLYKQFLNTIENSGFRASYVLGAKESWFHRIVKSSYNTTLKNDFISMVETLTEDERGSFYPNLFKGTIFFEALSDEQKARFYYKLRAIAPPEDWHHFEHIPDVYEIGEIESLM